MTYFKKNLRNNLKLSRWDAFFYSLMIGCGEGYFVAFALELGLGPVDAGLLATIPIFIGGVLQLIPAIWHGKLVNYHRFVFVASFVQALGFAPLVILAYLQMGNFWLLLIIISIYWACAFSIGPAWNVLMSGIVPHGMRQRFFSRRILISYGGMFLGVASSGIALELSKVFEKSLLIYAVMFLICLCSRSLSSLTLYHHQSATATLSVSHQTKLMQLLRINSRQNIGRIIAFVLLLKFAVFISAPFFVPYMLKELSLSYVDFMLIISASFVGKILISSNISKITMHLSKILFISGLGICFIPVVWLISPNPLFLTGIEIISGVLWGGFEYSFFLIIFNDIAQDEQTRYLSIYNFLNATAIILGSAAGGLIFAHVTNPYITVFVISSILRLGSLLLFPRIFTRAPIVIKHFTTRTLTLRPNQGIMDRPMVTSFTKEKGK